MDARILPGPWQTIDAYLITQGCTVGEPQFNQVNGGVHANHSAHYDLRARDYSKNPEHFTDLELAIKILKPLAEKGFKIEQMFYSPFDIFISRGIRVLSEKLKPKSLINPLGQNLFQIHKDHLHIALYGGFLISLP